jgi:two-component system chemotaxis sensor kinase CheA
MEMRMFPVAYLFDRFSRTVRDLSMKTGKGVDFVVSGREIELDRLVLDEINDAVMHLLRNAVDHGIEKPGDREKAGKKDTGKVILSAMREGNYVVISVEDDGRGMDVEEIKKIAVERKIITEEEASRMNDGDVYELLGAPGLSTTKKITDVSGRGVGFDVVKSKIKSLGGSVRISTEKGRGTNVELRLPLTTAIIQSLLVGVEKEKYAIPLDSVREIVAVGEEDLKTVEGKEIFSYREQVLPLLRLKNIFDVPGNKDKDRFGPVVVVERDEKLFGIMVDALIGQQETVVKPLEGMLKGRKEFAGATILGDGSVAFILDVGGLI